MQCPRCGSKNPDYAAYCGTCSAQIVKPRAGDAVEEVRLKCHSCGWENPPENRYCGACGTYLLDKETEGDGWTKTYGIPGFYESSISEGPSGAEIRTKFSFLGFQEDTRYPRWMVTLMAWILVALIFYLGLFIISEIGRVGTGLGVIALALLIAYAIYRVYYRPPLRHIG